MEAKRIIANLDEGILSFGTYDYYDKGPHDVMNVDEIVNEIKTTPVDVVEEILSEVIEHPHGPRLVECIFDELLEEEEAEDKYESMCQRLMAPYI